MAKAKKEIKKEEVKVEEVKEEVKNEPNKAPKKGKGLLITVIILGALLLIAINVIVALILINNDKNKNNTTTTTVTTTEKTVFKVTFNSNGADPIPDMEVKKDEKVTLPKPTKEGAEFLYWSDDNDNIYNDVVTFEEDTNLTANWKDASAKTMKITFDSKGGSKVSAVTYTCDKDSVTIKSLPKNPTKDSYEFKAWEDKHGKIILAGAKLTCENLTLYAVWEYDGPTANPEQNTDPTYKCDTGTLSGTKCIIEGTVHENCPSGTKVDGSLCIKTTDSNAGTRQCIEDTVSIDGKGHTWTGKGDYFFGSGHGQCAYYKWTAYTNQSACNSANDIYHRTVWVSELNGCYAEKKNNNYETVCSSDYQYYSSSELTSKFGLYDNGKCLRKVAKEKSCDSGYTLTNGKCIKTVDAKKE